MDVGVHHFVILRANLLNRYEEGFKLTGLIYIHRISDSRFTGTTGRNFKMFRDLCGDPTLKNVILVTNMWGAVSLEVGEARQKELSCSSFKPALDMGARIARHDNTTQSSHNVIRMIAVTHPIVPGIQRGRGSELEDTIDAATGETIEFNDRTERHLDELKRVQEDTIQALEKAEGTRKEPAEETGLQKRMEKIKKESDGLEARMKEMEQEAKKDRDWVDAGRQRQLADLSRRLQDVIDASAADRARLEQEIKDLRDRLVTTVTVPSQPTLYVSPFLLGHSRG